MLTQNKSNRAFSLVELLVVVVVIGILAAIIVPNTITAGDSARVAATAEDLGAIEKAIEAYRNQTGQWPRSVAAATMPAELEEYFTKSDPFAKTVPMGGVYDYDGGNRNRGPRIVIRGSSGNSIADDATILKLDEEMDDGDVSTGRLRRAGGRIEYYIQPGD